MRRQFNFCNLFLTASGFSAVVSHLVHSLAMNVLGSEFELARDQARIVQANAKVAAYSESKRLQDETGGSPGSDTYTRKT